MNTLVQNNAIISRELTAVEMENLMGGDWLGCGINVFGGAIIGFLTGSAVGTVTLPIVGTVSGAAAGYWTGAAIGWANACR